jgi:hypothetical protein
VLILEVDKATIMALWLVAAPAGWPAPRQVFGAQREDGLPQGGRLTGPATAGPLSGELGADCHETLR